MATYFLRRLLTVLPVLVGISLVLFTILALAPGDPFGELATNPNVPPEVRMNLRKQFGLDDPIALRYGRWFTSMVQGNWGFSFVSRVDVDVLIRQRLPTTLFVQVSALALALLVSLPVGILSARRPYSHLRSGRHDAGVHRLLPADVLHRAPVHPAVQPVPRLVAVHLSRGHPGDRAPVGLGEPEAGHHAHRRPRLLPGRPADAVRAGGGAGRDPARLHPHRAVEGAGRAHHADEARRAQRPHPGRDAPRDPGARRSSPAPS